MKKVNPIIAQFTIAIIIILIVIAGFVIKYVKGNKTFIDKAYDFDVAYIQMANGETVTVEINTWKDEEDGEQITIVAKDGTVYLTNSVRCDLVMFPK